MNNETKTTPVETDENINNNEVLPDEKAIYTTKNGLKKWIISGAAILVVLIITVCAVFPVGEFLEFDKGEGTDVVITVPEGSTADAIADTLIENGVIESKFAFKLKLKFHKNGNSLKYGEYPLNTSMTLSEVIDALSSGHQQGEHITIPEGYSAEMIASLCEETGICTRDEFLYALDNEVFDYEFLKNIPQNPKIKHRLQGFLFPDTYEYNATTTAKTFIDSMLKAFEKNVIIPQDKELNYYELLTLASIIEREAKMDNERNKISGVFMNRLKIDMPLQACATVIYAKSNGAYDMDTVLYSDLEFPSPYNTYRNEGLPVGPICNPGIKAIEAAINPESHSYLYYHTDEKKKDGSHIFTETYGEHNLTQK